MTIIITNSVILWSEILIDLIFWINLNRHYLINKIIIKWDNLWETYNLRIWFESVYEMYFLDSECNKIFAHTFINRTCKWINIKGKSHFPTHGKILLDTLIECQPLLKEIIMNQSWKFDYYIISNYFNFFNYQKLKYYSLHIKCTF